MKMIMLNQFEKDFNDTAQVTENRGEVSLNNEVLLLVDASQDGDVAIYTPHGSVFGLKQRIPLYSNC